MKVTSPWRDYKDELLEKRQRELDEFWASDDEDEEPEDAGERKPF